MENSKTYKLSLLSIFIPGILPIMLDIILIAIFVPIMIFHTGAKDQIAIWFMGIFVLIFFGLIPSALLLNYFINDLHKSIVIHDATQLLSYQHHSIVKRISFTDILKIEKYQSNSVILRLPISMFYYYKVYLHDKTYFRISNLVVRKLEKKLPSVEFEIKSVFYPLICKE